ncbi:putative transcriptional acitvator, Baf family [Solidesulfovibrio carbinoliphilus subsp. oakridgensis]|uniref:Type III pantothenate kinase n=1 Tax=Solidesulfovibrio carbinoliphilus subsp. oakridgensis TaxID=694327 RepID=G7Q6N5_9BACT|nr:type III pantothenate kinase [Solidesulfovibrio carbinoliphilus]EHJ47970.1 putative transcriptional acitvator, Baf family [Solidesulfovibrio carbinoliphilus subsp. oakridgensis]
MPALLIDVGNTNIKFGLAERTGLTVSFALPTDRSATPDSLGLAMATALSFHGCRPADVEAGLASSVVPPLNPILERAVSRYLGVRLKFVPADVPVPLKNRYGRPHEVGADRLVTAFAGRRAASARSVIVVDFGTATNFDCVTDDAFLGGLICPGMMTSLSGLVSKTAKLPHVALDPGNGALSIGRSTTECINQGFVFGFADMVQGVTARLKAHLGGEVQVLATGGFAEKLAPICPVIRDVRPELLLDGLRQLWLGQTRAGAGRKNNLS